MNDVRFKHPDWFSEHINNWNVWLDHLRNQPNIHAIEIGSFEGRSACWLLENILTHPSSRLLCIDPFVLGEDLRKQYNEQLLLETFRRNVLNTHPSKASFMQEPSLQALRKLKDNWYDLIYVDGSHVAADTLTDGILSWPLLKPGGVIIFDDYEWPWQDRIYPDNGPRKAIDAFLSVMSPQIMHASKGLQVYVQKKI